MYLEHIAIMRKFDRRDFEKFLFYDQIHVLDVLHYGRENMEPDVDILIEAGLLKLIKRGGYDLSTKNIHLLERLLALREHSIKMRPKLEMLCSLALENDETDFDSEELAGLIHFSEEAPVLQTLFYIDRLLQDGQLLHNYYPILEERLLKPYTQLTSGFSLNILQISIPDLPVKDLINFKHDNLDKLRRFRASINALVNTHNSEISYVLEELSLALHDYNISVERSVKKTSMSKMHFALNIIKDIPKLAGFDFSSISKSIEFKESQIIDTRSFLGHKEASYLYEIQNSLNR